MIHAAVRRPFRFHQLGYVVADLDTAMAWWSRALGVGPFFVTPEFIMPEFLYRGVPSTPSIRLALSHWGNQQIELIQQHNDAPSGYRAFMSAAPGGMQHLACWSDNITADLANYRARGLQIQQEGGSPVNDGTRFYYLDGDDHMGAVIELIDMTPAKYARFARIAEVAAASDGTEPVRPLAELR